MSDLNEKQKNKTVRKILFIVFAVFILAVAVLGFAGYRYVMNGLEPVDETSEEVIQVEIPSGSTRRNIAMILEEKGLINSSLVFDYYARFSDDNQYQAGYYLMSPSMSVDEMLGYLNDGGTPLDETLDRVAVPEGIHIDLIAARVEENTDFTADEFIEVVEDEVLINELVDKYPELLTDALAAKEETRYVLEGYLFPATYEVYQDTSLENLVTQMISRMNQAVQPHYEDIAESDLNVHETLALASHIEREGVTDEDRQLISGVFYNRLEVDMPLQTDPSVAYALGEHRERTSYADLEVDSPYNTYMYKGVGAGPINSPSESAIYASIHPEETDYLYFLADINTMEIYYSEDYEQHLRYRDEYINNND